MKKQTKKQEERTPRRARRPRGYTRGFTPKSGSRGREFKVREVPASFFLAVNAKVKREGQSVRGVALRLLEGWVNGSIVLPEAEGEIR